MILRCITAEGLICFSKVNSENLSDFGIRTECECTPNRPIQISEACGIGTPPTRKPGENVRDAIRTRSGDNKRNENSWETRKREWEK